MLTLTNAQSALKSVYLGVISNQINLKTNAFFAMINKSDAAIYGKEVIKTTSYGLTGGIVAGSETATLPTAYSPTRIQFKTELKNLYATLSISDKALRTGSYSSGAFVNLLQDEMQNLITSSAFNLSRMLYGDGTGYLATASVSNNVVTYDSVRNLVEGMKVDIYSGSTRMYQGILITKVDRENKMVSFETSCTVNNGNNLYATNSRDNEITGIKRLFDTSSSNSTLYGINRINYTWLYPYSKTNSPAVNISDSIIQSALNTIEEKSGNAIDFISVSGDVRSAYQTYLFNQRRNIDIITLEGGFRSISYCGIPVVYERFVEDGGMYLLNTKDFNLYQLCDWSWIEGEDGNILIPSTSNPSYSATLVKYCELMCDKPGAQGRILGITG